MRSRRSMIARRTFCARSLRRCGSCSEPTSAARTCSCRAATVSSSSTSTPSAGRARKARDRSSTIFCATRSSGGPVTIRSAPSASSSGARRLRAASASAVALRRHARRGGRMRRSFFGGGAPFRNRGARSQMRAGVFALGAHVAPAGGAAGAGFRRNQPGDRRDVGHIGTDHRGACRRDLRQGCREQPR